METQIAFPTLLGVLWLISSREFYPVPLEDIEWSMNILPSFLKYALGTTYCTGEEKLLIDQERFFSVVILLYFISFLYYKNIYIQIF